MRRTRDGETTKTEVIDAAKVVFAKYGFAGTSLAMISEKSGISDGLILHHFKSKENLYHVVLEELAAEYYAVIEQAGAEAHNPQQAALMVLQAAFEYWQNDQAYNRISMWAYLEDRTEFVEQEFNLTADLAKTIAVMQENGQADTRFSPFALLTMTIGPLHFWMRYHDLFRQATGYDGTLRELDQDFEEQFIRLVMKTYLPEGGFSE